MKLEKIRGEARSPPLNHRNPRHPTFDTYSLCRYFATTRGDPKLQQLINCYLSLTVVQRLKFERYGLLADEKPMG